LAFALGLLPMMGIGLRHWVAHSEDFACSPFAPETRVQRSGFQFAFELVEKPPIAAIGNNLLRARLEHAQLMKVQRVEADCVFVVVFPPLVIQQFLKRLPRIVVAPRKPAIDEQPRGLPTLSLSRSRASLIIVRITIVRAH
jgi:hypothetical protein